MKSLAKLALLGTLFFSTSTFAGGYQLLEYSATGLGRSFAGAGIVGDDYSAIAFNPAGMSLMPSGVQGGIKLVNMDARMRDLNTDQRDRTNIWQSVPHFFGQYKVNDSWDVGLGIYTPFGLGTQYSSNWFASDKGIDSILTIIDIAPAASYRVNEQWTVGATVIARYIYANLTNTLNVLGGGDSSIKATGWTVTGKVGIMYEPMKNTRFGLAYHAKSKQRVHGSQRVSGIQGPFAFLNGIWRTTSEPDLPESVWLTGYTQFGGKKFGLSGLARWTRWGDTFRTFDINTQWPLGAISTQYNWKNSWTLTAGLDYFYNDNWTFRIGTGWDQSPSRSAAYRTIRIPDSDRIWASCGISYKTGPWQVDVGFAHMFMKTAEVRNPVDAPFQLKYNTGVNLLGAQVQYRF